MSLAALALPHAIQHSALHFVRLHYVLNRANQSFLALVSPIYKKRQQKLSFFVCRQSLTTFELAFDFIKQLVQLPQLEKDMRDYALLTQNQDGSRMFFVL